jgi:hypothetical protein
LILKVEYLQIKVLKAILDGISYKVINFHTLVVKRNYIINNDIVLKRKCDENRVIVDTLSKGTM